MKTRLDVAQRRLRVAVPRQPPPLKLTGKGTAGSAAASLQRDQFVAGNAGALRARLLGAVAPSPLPVAAAAPQVSAAAATSAVTAGRTGGPLQPVFSFDTTTYLSKVGNPPEYRITQQQCDELRRLGMQHGVVGMPTSKASPAQFAEQMAALKQELTLLAANGIKTDTYLYMNWTQGGQPKTDAQVRAEMNRLLDGMNGLPVKTFWFDVESDPNLNPSAGVKNHQRILDTAYQAFNDWKAAHPDSQLEFGIYTGKSAWTELMGTSPSDPYLTKYAAQGVPLWHAAYPRGYDLTDASQGASDMANAVGEGYGGWSMEAGNVRGWQYRAGEHDGHRPTFNYGLDRNVWLDDPSVPAPPITAVPSGSRSDLPVVNQPLYQLLQQDEGKPIDQRQYKSMQEIINAVYSGKTTFKKLGLTEAEACRYRWEDPWKAVYGLPLGTDQFSSQPLAPAPAAPVTPAPTGPTTPTTPTTPTPAAPAPGPTADLAGMQRGMAATTADDRARIKRLQDALMSLGYLQDIKTNSGYGRAFGPLTEGAVKAFQADNGLPTTGAVDAATATALANPRPRAAGFAAGIAAAHRDALGLPTGAPYTTADGALRQDFDRGSVWVTPDRVLHAEVSTAAGPQELVPPRKLGTAQTLEEAGEYFLTQWGPTATNDPVGGSDRPWGYKDCGPTSAVMALAALGLAPRPGPADAAVAIDKMRDAILGYDSSSSIGLGLLPAVKGTVGYGLVQAGAQVTGLKNTLAEVDAAIARGNPVIIGSSTTYTAWGRSQLLAGNYLNSSDPGGHFVTVLGRAANGNYLVGDPLVKGGPMEITAAQLQTALNGAWNSGNSLAEVSVPAP